MGQPLGSVQGGNEQIKSSPGEKDWGELVGETGHALVVGAGLHPKPHGQQEGGNSAPLLHSGETPPAVLCQDPQPQRNKDLELLQ